MEDVSPRRTQLGSRHVSEEGLVPPRNGCGPKGSEGKADFRRRLRKWRLINRNVKGPQHGGRRLGFGIWDRESLRAQRQPLRAFLAGVGSRSALSEGRF